MAELRDKENNSVENGFNDPQLQVDTNPWNPKLMKFKEWTRRS